MPAFRAEGAGYVAAVLRRLATFVLVVVAFAAAAGCGGEEGTSQEEYERTIAETRERVDSALGDLRSGAEDIENPADIRGLVGDTQDALLDEANKLDGIDPPKDVEEQHEQVVGALQELADQDLEDVDRAAEGELGADEIDEVRRRLTKPNFESVEQLQRAFDEIEEKGYDVGAAE